MIKSEFIIHCFFLCVMKVTTAYDKEFAAATIVHEVRILIYSDFSQKFNLNCFTLLTHWFVINFLVRIAVIRFLFILFIHKNIPFRLGNFLTPAWWSFLWLSEGFCRLTLKTKVLKSLTLIYFQDFTSII